MNTLKTRPLTLALLTILASASVQAQTAAPPTDARCTATECSNANGLLFRLQTRGESQPLTQGTTDHSSSSALQPDRRVTVETTAPAPAQRPGKGVAVGMWSIDLPDGGVVWATEDPQLAEPKLSVSAQSTLLAFDGTRVVEPVRFSGFTNYGAFIERAEVAIYSGNDHDLTKPLVTLPLVIAQVPEAIWNGELPTDAGLRTGDTLVYVVRAYGAGGSIDETIPRELQLLNPAEAQQARRAIVQTASRSATGVQVTALNDSQRMAQDTYGLSTLRRQNILVRGSRVRVQGRDLPVGASLTLNGQTIPVDREGAFVTEYLLPIGRHTFDVAMTDFHAAGEKFQQSLDVDVTGRYFFGVALADLTLSGQSVSGAMSRNGTGTRYDKDSLVEGRLAFYLKRKFNGRFLLTAQADTQEREVSQLFNHFWRAQPGDVFRRLDPDRQYPVYGDDSTTTRDVDSMGRLYLRLDWDKNQALWGNFNTGLTGTEFGQYSRSLYGAALAMRSAATTPYAEPKAVLRAFASQAQTAPGHGEFLGTGGSLYYLKHTDLLPGSDKLVVETRDPATGRVEHRATLLRGVDYEIDELQGRILLTTPLATLSRDNVRNITRDTPLSGYQQVLLVDYEFVPQDFRSDATTSGLRAKHWFGDHVGIGATYVNEQRSGDDYRLAAADLTLQAGRGTYLKLEQAHTQSTSAPVFFSDNGGLSFSQINPVGVVRSGDARSIEARLNTRELGWTQRQWTAGAWWRDVDRGYSIARFDTGSRIHETGAEVLGEVTDQLRLYARASRAERDAASLSQSQITADWRIGPASQLSAEVRRTQARGAAAPASAGTLLGLRYGHRFWDVLELYGAGQVTLDDDGGRYPRNNAVTLGAKYRFGDLSNVGVELTAGDRGNAATMSGEYRLASDHSVYGSYTYSSDTTAYDPLFNPRGQTGWTLGQRWRLNNQVNLFNESQFLKTLDESGIAHTFGMDFYPSQGWNLGYTLQTAHLEKLVGAVDRNAVSIRGGYQNRVTQWQSKLEWRRDTGAEQRRQWVTTNWLTHTFNPDWRIAARLNLSETRDALQPAAGARFVEGNVGFAWRPRNNTRYALFGKYTYLYDVSALQQIGDSMALYDQRSQVVSLEGIYHPSHRWEFAGKLAQRRGQVRFGRLAGQWASSDASFAAVQARYGIGNTDWNLLGEYRWLGVHGGSNQQGALFGVDRDIGQHFRIGAGYNFSNINDNLTNFDGHTRGWFLNVSGRY